MTPTGFSVTRRDCRGATVTLSNRFELPVAIALGELDAAFGNHPAYLALDRNGHPQAAPKLICRATPAARGQFRSLPAHRDRAVAGCAPRRPQQLSLNEDGVTLDQPRPVVDGDVKGGRYVSGTVDLVVGHGPISWPARRHW